MELKLIRGISGAQDLLTRLDPLDFTGLPETVLSRTREIFGDSVTPEASVIKMLHDVRDNGDHAVRHYAKLLDGVELDDLRVSPQQMEQAGHLFLKNCAIPLSWPPSASGSSTKP